MTDSRSADGGDFPHVLRGGSAVSRLLARPPSVSLTWVSIIVGLVAFVLPHVDTQVRSLFVLPFPALWLSTPTAVLAWVIALRCWGRPGGTLPSLWSIVLLLLAQTAMAVTVLEYVEAQPITGVLSACYQSSQHIFAVATAGAVLAASPRLIHMYPNNRWTYRIAPVALVAGVLLTVPTMWGLGNGIAKSRVGSHEAAVQRLQDARDQLHTATQSLEWAGLFQQPPATVDEAFDPLERWAEQYADVVPPPAQWVSATALGRGHELQAPLTELIDHLVASFEAEQAPRMSSVPFQGVRLRDRQDPTSWEFVEDHKSLSKSITRYHTLLGNILLGMGERLRATDELMAAAAACATTSPELLAVQDHYQSAGTQIRSFIETQLLASWPDYWVAHQLPAPLQPDLRGDDGEGGLSWQALLSKPALKDSAGQDIAAADAGRLLGLSYGDVSQLVDDAPGCRLTSQYNSQNVAVARLDCVAYRPVTGRRDTDASPQSVLRVVYTSRGEAIPRATKPAEIYYLFVPADGDAGEAFERKLMRQFFTTATTLASDGDQVRWRSGREVDELRGFTFRDGPQPYTATISGEQPSLDNKPLMIVRAVPGTRG